jgi:hypothetical protein
MMYEAKLRLGEKRAIHPCARVNPCCRSGSGTIRAKTGVNIAFAAILVVVTEEW